MDRFVSNYTLRLDAKGRVSIPAPFRAVLARDGFDGLYCYPALDQPALDAGGNALLGRDRGADRALSALFGRARAILARALRHQRDAEDRRRGPGDPVRRAEERMPASRTRSPSSGSATSFRSGSLDASARNSRRPPGRCARSRSNWAPGWRRKTRTEHGNDGGQRRHTRCRWRTGPSHSRARAAGRSSFSQPRDGGVYIDGTFGAGGYTRAILDGRATRVIGIDRDQSAIAGGAGLVAAGGGPADAGRGSLLRARTRRARASATTRSTASCSISACPRCSSTRPSAASRSARRPARHAHGRRGAERGRRGGAASERDLAAHHRDARRGALRARRRARHRRSARGEQPIDDHATRSPTSSAASCARSPGEIHPATRTFQALRMFVNDELGELARRSRRPSACSSPAAGWWWSRSIRSRTASSRRSSPSAAAPCGGSRHLPEVASAAADLPLLTEAPGRRRRSRDRRQSARALGQAARRRAHRRAAARGRSRAICCRGCRRSPTSMRGGDDHAPSSTSCVLGALVLAAADVYKIKFESTLRGRAGRQAAQRNPARAGRIAALRAEWAKLDNPARIQELAQRHLDAAAGRGDASSTRSTDLPERPPELVPPGTADPIGAVIETLPTSTRSTGSVPRAKASRDDATRLSQTSPETAAMAQPAPAEPWRRRVLARAALRPQRRPHRQGARAASASRSSPSRRSMRSSPAGWSCSRWRRTATWRGAARRGDAVATARPDILDRNGEILATDVRAPSLFAEPRASSTSTRRSSCSPP